MKIGLLDFGIRSRNKNSLSIIEDVVDYTVSADKLGFERIWLSEHHNFDPSRAWLNPEVLIPILAGLTNDIKIGSGGILLAQHSPYRIAHTFKLLNNLFNNRIDLGIAKGYTNKESLQGSDLKTPDIKEVSDVLHNNLSLLSDYYRKEDENFKNEIVIPPYKGDVPDIWYLTGSYKNLKRVTPFGVNISRSFFHRGANLDYGLEELERFKEDFFELHGKLPKVSIAFSGCCDINEKKARSSYENYSFGFTPDNIVGSPSLFEDKLCTYQEHYNIDEFVFMNVALESQSRIRGLELLADQMKLNA